MIARIGARFTTSPIVPTGHENARRVGGAAPGIVRHWARASGGTDPQASLIASRRLRSEQLDASRISRPASSLPRLRVRPSDPAQSASRAGATGGYHRPMDALWGFVGVVFGSVVTGI